MGLNRGSDLVHHKIVRHLLHHLVEKAGSDTAAILGIIDTFDDPDDTESDRLTKSWGRTKKSLNTGGNITRRVIEDFLRVTTFDTIEDYVRYYGLNGLDEVMLAPMREALADDEKETRAFLNQSEAHYQTKPMLGRVIELQRFNLSQPGVMNNGIEPEYVQIKTTGLPKEYHEGLQDKNLEVPGAHWKKYCLDEIQPDDAFDAEDGTATLSFTEISYKTVKQCDPSIFHCDNGSEVEINGRTVDNAVRAENRFRFGDLDPQKQRVPYCQTLFFTVVLKDEKILMLRRHDKVGWDRNKVELSAGEQLWEEDLKAANPFAAWMTRGILEEFFPSKGLPQVMLDRIKKEFFGYQRLYAVGYEVGSCSYPVFGICQAKVDEDGYAALLADAFSMKTSSRNDIEGMIGVLTFDQLRAFLRDGHVCGRRLFLERGDPVKVTFGQTAGKNKPECFELSAKDLHPMTPYRIALLLDALAV